jgi:hypothetical protein
MTRNFAEILAEWQGGIRPRPGTTCIVEDVPEKLITDVWGYVPSGVSFGGATIMFKETRPGFYRVKVHFT